MSLSEANQFLPRTCVALAGGQAEQPHGLALILGHANTQMAASAKMSLGARVAQVAAPAEQVKSLLLWLADRHHVARRSSFELVGEDMAMSHCLLVEAPKFTLTADKPAGSVPSEVRQLAECHGVLLRRAALKELRRGRQVGGTADAELTAQA